MTLDTNELFNIRDGSGDVSGLRRLMELHSNGTIRLCIPAIAASENQPGGTTLHDYAAFQAFVASLGLTNCEELQPMAYIDVTFWDHCLITDPDMEQLEGRIHVILFPNIEFSYEDYVARVGGSPDLPLDRRWRRAKCDVQAIWSHIHHRADIFVTEDGNFHKATKKPKLSALGAGAICTPSECVPLVIKARARRRGRPRGT